MDLIAAACSGTGAEFPAEHSDSLSHSDDTVPDLVTAFCRSSAAIVEDEKIEVVLVVIDRDRRCHVRPSMSNSVGQRFLDDSICRQFGSIWQSPHVSFDLQVNREPRGPDLFD